MDYKPTVRVDKWLWVTQDNQFLLASTGNNPKAGVKTEIFRIGNPDPIAIVNYQFSAGFSHPGRGVSTFNNEITILCSKSDPAFLDTATPVSKEKNDLPALQVKEKFKLDVPAYPMPGVGFGATAFSSNGKYLLASEKDKVIRIFDVATAKPIKTMPGGFDSIFGVAMSGDDTIFISGVIGKSVLGASNCSIAKVSLATGKGELITGLTFPRYKLQTSPDGSRLYAIGLDRSLGVWDVKTGKMLHAWQNLPNVPANFEQSPNGKLGLLVMNPESVLLQLESFREAVRIPAKAREVCMFGNGSLAASIAKEVTLNVWDLKSGNLAKSIELAGLRDTRKYFVRGGSADGKYVYLLGELENLFDIVDIESGKIVMHFQYQSPPGEFSATRGNLIAYRTLSDLRLIELPAIPAR